MSLFFMDLVMTIQSTQTLLNRLQYSELVDFFPPQIRSAFYNTTNARTCKAGEVIFKRGDEGPWMGAILAGRVRLCIRSQDGKEVLLSMVDRGEVFGERAFFDYSMRAGDAIAEEETTFLVITREEFFPILHSHPHAMFSIIQMLCRRINGYLNTLELYSLQNMPARVAQALMYLAQKFGKEIDGKTVIHAGYSQSNIGQMIGSTRESVNKQLKTFVDKGYIAQNGEDIIIINPAHLQQMVTPMALE